MDTGTIEIFEYLLWILVVACYIGVLVDVIFMSLPFFSCLVHNLPLRVGVNEQR